MRWFKMTQLSDRTCTKLSSDSKKLCKASASGKFALGHTGGCCTFQTRCKPPFISFPIGKERWPTSWTGHLRYPVYLNPYSFSSVLIPFIIFIYYCHRYRFCTRLFAVLTFVFFVWYITVCGCGTRRRTWILIVLNFSTLDVSRICTIPGSLSSQVNKQKGSILPLVNTAGFTVSWGLKNSGCLHCGYPDMPNTSSGDVFKRGFWSVGSHLHLQWSRVSADLNVQFPLEWQEKRVLRFEQSRNSHESSALGASFWIWRHTTHWLKYLKTMMISHGLFLAFMHHRFISSIELLNSWVLNYVLVVLNVPWLWTTACPCDSFSRLNSTLSEENKNGGWKQCKDDGDCHYSLGRFRFLHPYVGEHRNNEG